MNRTFMYIESTSIAEMVPLGKLGQVHRYEMLNDKNDEKA